MKLLTAEAKSFKMGGKGDRYVIKLDKIELSEEAEQQITETRIKHTVASRNPLLNIEDFIRNKKIEINII